MKLGIYRHYKGNLYQVLGVGSHTESGEIVVIYQALYDSFGLWVRPLKMFEETIKIDGKECKRFTLVSAPLENQPQMRQESK